MSTEPEEVWSADDENYSFDTLYDVLSCMDEPEVGTVVYVGLKRSLDPAEFVDAEDVIENIACRGSDVGGEWADDYPEVTKEAKAELDELLAAWARKYCQPSFFTVERLREHIVTQEDLDELNGVNAPAIESSDGTKS